jgi:CHASE3 domain sensor protein
MEDYSQNITNNFGWLEIAFFYGIAIGVCYWQWAKMRREVREMRAEREAREAEEAARKKAAKETDPDEEKSGA